MHVEKSGRIAFCGENIAESEECLQPQQVPQALATAPTPKICNSCMGEIGKTWSAGRQILPPPALPPEIAARLRR